MHRNGQVSKLAINLEKIAKTNKKDWNEASFYKLIELPEDKYPSRLQKMKIVTEQSILDKEKTCWQKTVIGFFWTFQIFKDPVQRTQVFCFSCIMIFLYLIYDGTIIATENIGLANMYVNGVL